jgi:hypothetical protein
MIIPNEIATELLGEARLRAGSTNFSDAPDLNPDEKFARTIARHPLPELGQISSMLEEVFWASQLSEENRPCRPRLLYAPRQESLRPAIHRFVQPVPLTRSNLRKLAPLQGPLGYLTWNYFSDCVEITGIQWREGGDPCDFIVIAPRNGALDVYWDGGRLVALRDGKIQTLSKEYWKDGLSLFQQVGKWMGKTDLILLNRTIRTISDAGHGGAIWILREECALNDMQIGHVIKLDERPLSLTGENRHLWLKSIGHLAAIDGAVLINARLQVLAVGTFIEISKDVKNVDYINNNGETQQRLSTEIGGGRHRSAIEFCSRFAPAAAFVVSEDGYITLILSKTADDIFAMPFPTLGITSDHLI